MPRGTQCIAHCVRCGCHFSGVSAFDAHKRGKYRPKPGERGRYCVDPEDAADVSGKDLFMPVTTRGVCTIYRPLQRNVTVWTLRDSYERAQDIWNQEEEPKPEPEEIQVRRRPRRKRKLEDVR